MIMLLPKRFVSRNFAVDVQFILEQLRIENQTVPVQQKIKKYIIAFGKGHGKDINGVALIQPGPIIFWGAGMNSCPVGNESRRLLIFLILQKTSLWLLMSECCSKKYDLCQSYGQ